MAAKRKGDPIDGKQKAKALKSRKHDDAPSSPKANYTREPEPNRTTPSTTATATEHDNKSSNGTTTEQTSFPESTTFQIITGSYERVLHGFTATIPSSLITSEPSQSLTIPELKEQPKVEFTDTFLFNAHTSAIRCLALTPPSDEASKVLLATGSTDERINIYSLSKTPPSSTTRNNAPNQPKLPSLHGTSISENAANKEMGSLLHHSSTVTALHFPTRSKLLSASEDSTVAITRTRDWEPLSTIKAPIPKAVGRPSGDTAPPGEVPAGVTDFAVHPSMKLMLTVGRGEKCMRLWNLVTGKKAGVLTFTKEVLASAGETRFSNGEAKSVVWDPKGEEFAVGFDRGVVVFGIDCVPKTTILPFPRTKIHKLRYLPLPPNPTSTSSPPILLISTEDGRILLYNTDPPSPSNDPTPPTHKPPHKPKPASEYPPATLLAQIGGPAAGITSRVKDFDMLPLKHSNTLLIVAASSDGSVRLWTLDPSTLVPSSTSSSGDGASAGQKKEEKEGDGGGKEEENAFTTKQLGKLVGMYATGTRVTCVKAFEMSALSSSTSPQEDDEDGAGEAQEEEGSDSSSDGDDE